VDTYCKQKKTPFKSSRADVTSLKRTDLLKLELIRQFHCIYITSLPTCLLACNLNPVFQWLLLLLSLLAALETLTATSLRVFSWNAPTWFTRHDWHPTPYDVFTLPVSEYLRPVPRVSSYGRLDCTCFFLVYLFISNTQNPLETSKWLIYKFAIRQLRYTTQYVACNFRNICHDSANIVIWLVVCLE